MDVDIEFAQQAAEKAKAKKEADRRDSEAEYRLQQACAFSNAAWNAWPDAWNRAADARENQADTEPAINALAKVLKSLVEAIRVNDHVANLALAAERFDPSYCDGTDDEQDADAVKIVIQALQAVVSGSDSGVVAGQLLSLDPLPVLSRGNSARRLLRVANDWPLHCEGCNCIQPPDTFDSTFCGECHLRGESMQLVIMADSLKRPNWSRQLLQSINELDREIEEAVRTLELWEIGMDKCWAAHVLIRFLSESTGEDFQAVGLMCVRPALEKAIELHAAITADLDPHIVTTQRRVTELSEKRDIASVSQDTGEMTESGNSEKGASRSTIKLTETQKSYVLAASIWLAYKRAEDEKYLAGKRGRPKRKDVHSIAIALGWKGTAELFHSHVTEGTKPNGRWFALSDEKSWEIKIPK
jgi:hypothetical protein